MKILSSLNRRFAKNGRPVSCMGILIGLTLLIWMFYTLICYMPKPLTPLLRFFSGFVIQLVPRLLCNGWQNFEWRIASRGPSAVGLAQLLVKTLNGRYTCSASSCQIVRRSVILLQRCRKFSRLSSKLEKESITNLSHLIWHIFFGSR